MNEFDQVKHAYNCDLNYPGELFPPAPRNVMGGSMGAFQQRLQELVGNRDRQMAEKIDSLLRENSGEKRFFFAVGFSKTKVFISRELQRFALNSSVHLMGGDGIVAKLKRDHRYSVTRLCTDAADFRVVFL